MRRGFSSETALELRLILKTNWSAALRDALIAATTEYRRATRRQPAQNDASIRDHIRRDLDKLVRSSSNAQATLQAIDPSLRSEIIATTVLWLPGSFGAWMAGFAALDRYATHARSAVAHPTGRHPNPARRSLAVAVERAFRTHGISVSNTREGMYARTLDALLVAGGGHRGDHWHLLPAQRRERPSLTVSPAPRAASPLKEVAGWRYANPVRPPSPRRAIQTALGEAGRLPRVVHLSLLTDLTQAVRRVRRKHHPDERVRRPELRERDYGALRRVVASCDRLDRCLDRLEREHGLFNHYRDDWIFMTGYPGSPDEWRDGLALVSTECEALALQATTRDRGRPRKLAREALALELAGILSRHGIEVPVSRTPSPGSRLLLRCLELAGESPPRVPYRLLRGVADQLPTYMAETRRRRTRVAALLSEPLSIPRVR